MNECISMNENKAAWIAMTEDLTYFSYVNVLHTK